MSCEIVCRRLSPLLIAQAIVLVSLSFLGIWVNALPIWLRILLSVVLGAAILIHWRTLFILPLVKLNIDQEFWFLDLGDGYQVCRLKSYQLFGPYMRLNFGDHTLLLVLDTMPLSDWNRLKSRLSYERIRQAS